MNIICPVSIQLRDCMEKTLCCQFFFLQNHGEALTFEGTGIQDLIAAACFGRERDQKSRLLQCQKLADRIGSGSGDDQIAQGKEIRQLFLHIFELQIAWSAFQRFVQLSLAAQMDDLPVFQKFRQCIADCFVHCGSTKTSAHDHQNWSVSRKSSELQCCFAASFRKLFTDGTAGENCFLRWKILQSLREVAAYFCSRRHGQLVGKTRR